MQQTCISDQLMVWQIQPTLIKANMKINKRDSRFSEDRRQVDVGLRSDLNSCSDDTM